ncbi:MAG: hydrogenase 4 subunit F [Gammaproteobacteria bacterium CG22_combo_CG10-13_8_21_14_all_40_8]|nr:MAG: hydrogenase 4 subunit F [Gammaproteobacteria bacterium CG22_combo_CG10-13_8_21_14_all_40_8]
MNLIYLTLITPLIGGFTLAWVKSPKLGATLNSAFSLANVLVAAALLLEVSQQTTAGNPSSNWYVDSLSVYLIGLTVFVGFTTSIFSKPYMLHEAEVRSLTNSRMRLYHASFQGFIFTMLLALSTNNLGILWVALEGATLATVLLVSLYRTQESIEAAWKYFILCGVGIAQALFGTVLIYYAAAQVIPNGDSTLLWTELSTHAPELNPVIVSIAFVFLIVGYGTKVGLVPLHNWLPDAHSEGPTPMSAVLSGLLLNVALYALIRFKMITDSALQFSHMPHLAGFLMMGFGLLSFSVAALFLHRQTDIKRLFSYSSIEHMALMTFGIGLGTPLSVFAALLHMLVHGLTKSAIFITVGHASQIAGTQRIEKIRGLIQTQPSVGWGLMLGTAAIAGFPPFGIFTSEFLLLSSTIHTYPWLAIPLLTGLAIAFAGLFRHIQPICFGIAPEGQKPVPATMWPVYLHLTLVLILGIALSEQLSMWFDKVTLLITGSHVL